MQNSRLITTQFLLLCLSGLLFFSSFNMIMPELPAFLTSLGGEDHKGLIISLFTLTAGLSRPFSGKLTDTIGRIPVMVIGAFVCVVCGVLYPMVGSVFAFLLLRLLHGFSTGFKPTGTAAYIADIVPIERRGEAMGYVGFAGSFGIALGPILGSWIIQVWSMEIMFYTSSLFAFLSVFVLLNMRETLQNRQRFSFKLLKVSREDFFEPDVLPASVVILFSVYGFGVVLTIIPDFAVHLGIANKGLFFGYFTMASLFTRLFFGKMSDRFGREPVIIIMLAGLVIVYMITGFVTTPNGLMICAAMLGFLTGNLTPAVFAWTIDLGDIRYIGKAMATLYIALEIGIGVGALLTGFIYNNAIENIRYVFAASSTSAGLGLLFICFYYLRKKRYMRADSQSSISTKSAT